MGVTFRKFAPSLLIFVYLLVQSTTSVLRKMTLSSSRKRKDKAPQEAPLEWGPKVNLSKLPFSQQKDLYRENIDPIDEAWVCERPVKVDELQGYGVVEGFEQLGWEAGLTYCNNDKEEIYIEEVKQWMSTLKRNLGPNPPLTTTLKGKVHGVDVVLSMAVMDKIASFDSGIKRPGGEYTYLSDGDMYSVGKTKGDEWIGMLEALFDVPGGDYANYKPLERKHLKPLPHLISKIMMYNIIPRRGDYVKIRNYEVKVLYALTTGRINLSLKQLIMLNIWETRESYARRFVPHCRLIVHLLELKKVIPRSALPEIVDLNPFSRDKFKDVVYFTETVDRFILTCKDSQKTYERHKNVEEIEEAEMHDVNHEPQIGGREYAGQPQGYGQWPQFQRLMWDQVQTNHAEVMRRLDEMEEHQRQIDRCHVYDREYYQQEFYEYTERLRHDMNLQRNQGYHPRAQPFDYSRATPQDHINLPPYPGHSEPLYWPQDLSHPRMPQLQNPHSVSQEARRLWKSAVSKSQDA
ncbi:hypothetical protein QVD17_03143 [Tagetes erecta]|uniref:Uncharacterized protein n=1 Tax=Tagetes erecta TaxID=13708 RepID=A0AAD8LF72_TARER|nr:hypothetical protein QVD17_03143 [Tagetes erecta]